MADVAEIRALIERWADAVHAGDLDSVVADHAVDIGAQPVGGAR